MIDLIFALLFLLAVPATGLLSHRRLRSALEHGQYQIRIRTYWRIIILQALTSVALLTHWALAGRRFQGLGLRTPTGFAGYSSFLFLFGAAVVMFWMRARLRKKEALRTEAWNQVIGFIDLLPHNKRELHISYLLAAVVGFSEELAFRGFLIWWLTPNMHEWTAVLLIASAFGMAHLYQGRKGVIKTGIAGIIFGGIYIVSGHLWVPILLHALADAHTFRVAILLQNRQEWTDSKSDAWV
jgi:membrane protease YdiL (CAAX protease family)